MDIRPKAMGMSLFARKPLFLALAAALTAFSHPALAAEASCWCSIDRDLTLIEGRYSWGMNAVMHRPQVGDCALGFPESISFQGGQLDCMATGFFPDGNGTEKFCIFPSTDSTRLLADGAQTVSMFCRAFFPDPEHPEEPPTEVTETNVIDIEVDSTPPVVTIVTPASGTIVPYGPLTITGSISDQTRVLSLVVNGVEISSPPESWSVTIQTGTGGLSPTSGPIRISPSAIDVVGNILTSFDNGSSTPTVTTTTWSGSRSPFFGFTAINDVSRSIIVNVDGEGPALTFTVNVNEQLLSATISGTAIDQGFDTGVTAVQVSVLDLDTNRYFKNGAFASEDEVFTPAGISPVAQGPADWSFEVFNLVAGHSYQVKAQGIDGVGNIGMVSQGGFGLTDPCLIDISSRPDVDPDHSFEKAVALFHPIKGLFGGVSIIRPWREKGHVSLYINSDSAFVEQHGGRARNSPPTTLWNQIDENGGILPDIEQTDGKHFLVESSGYFGVYETDFEEFLPGRDITNYWGAAEPEGGLTSMERNDVAVFGVRKIGAGYGFKKNWRGQHANRYRCDGLVVAAYASIQRDPTSGDMRWRENSPARLFNEQLGPIAPNAPGCASTTITTSTEGYHFSVTGDDGLDGSGMDRVEFYNGDPRASGRLIARDEKDSLGPRTFTATSRCNPGSNLYVKLVDQAGNYNICKAGASQFSSVVPPILSPQPQGAPPVIRSLSAVDAGSSSVRVTWQVDPGGSPVSIAHYAVDVHFDDWDDEITPYDGRAGSHTFTISAGAHTLFFAVFDADDNLVTQSVDFTVGGSLSLIGQHKIDLDGIELEVDAVTEGMYASNRLPFELTPEGYEQLSGGDGSYDVWTTAVLNGPARLTASCTPGTYSSERLREAKLFHYGGSGFEDITTSVDSSRCSATGLTSTFSPFMIVLPTTTTTGELHTLAGGTVSGLPEVEFETTDPILILNPVSASTPTLQAALARMEDAGMRLAGGLYHIAPEEQYFVPAATLTFRYDRQALEQAGLDGTSLGLYTYDRETDEFVPLGSTDDGNGTLRAEVTRYRAFIAMFAPINVAPVAGIDIGRDAMGNLWTTVREEESASLAKTSPSGVFVASAPLAGAITSFPLSVFFDGAGRAHVVGNAEGTGSDVAVYRASLAGDEIVSVRTLDSGYANNDFVFAVSAPGWIVGAVQTAGPVGEEEGDRAFSLALWRYDPTTELLTLTTTYSRAGLDVGTGVALDADGNIWVSGYSQSPSTSSRPVDLALWKFSPDGSQLSAGPFLRSRYLSDYEGEVFAKLLISQGDAFVSSARLREAGGFDLAMVRFALSSGAVLGESAWRRDDLLSAAPAALLRDAAGRVVVAGSVGGRTGRAAVWTYDGDAAPSSAQEAQAGAANGAVYQGSDLWLAVEGATTPYLAAGLSPMAGGLRDIQPPRTTLVAEPSFLGGDVTYVSSASLLGFQVADDKLVPGDEAGVGGALTFHSSDGGSFSQFLSSFQITSEGLHALAFFSRDAEGNEEPVVTADVAVDLTSPQVALHPSGTMYQLIAEDPVVAEVASGVREILYVVDVDPETCDEVERDTGALRGTCANPFYSGPFSLSHGTHTVAFAAIDNVGNGEDVVYSSFVFVPAASAPLSLVSVAPTSGEEGSVVNVTATGDGFTPDTTLKLIQAVSSPGSWSPAASLGGVRSFQFGIVRLADGRVLVAGGSGPSATAEIYDPATDQWSATGSMGTARDLHSLTLLADGRVLAAGGRGAGGTPLATAEVYDPATGLWTPTGAMPRSHAEHVAELLDDGRVLVAGGVSGGSVVAAAEIYDPVTGTWSMTGSMTSAHMRARSVRLQDGRVLLAGGVNAGFSFTGVTEIYDPATGAWSATGSLNAPRQRHTMTRLTDGRVLAAGGDGGSVLASAEVYDPAAGAWTFTGSMASVRQQADAVRVHSGQVLVFGGSGPSGNVTRTELYDPSSGAWGSTATLTTGAFGNAGVLLLDGRVLAVGGFNASFTATASALFNAPASTIVATGVSVTGSTQLTGTLDLSGQPTGLWDVVVSNPDGQSATLPAAFTVFVPVVVPPPSVTAITPASGFNDDAALAVVVTGANFLAGSELRLSKAGETDIVAGNVVVASSTSLSATLDLTGRAAGSWDVVVSTDGRTGALSAGFSIEFPPPFISTFSPSSGFDDETISFFLDGGAFQPGAQVRLIQAGVASASWTATGSPAAFRSFQYRAVRLNDGRVLVAGGQGSGGPTASAELYDPASGAWSATGPMGTPRDQHSMTLLVDGRVLAAGGRDAGGLPLASAEVYDPASGVWSPTGAMPRGHAEHVAERLPDGRVLAAGGISAGGIVAAAEVYDPASGTWAGTGAMTAPHARARSVLLADGKVLVAGGIDAALGYSAVAERYDPASGTWSATGALNVSRQRHVMVRLLDGQVLAAGGDNGVILSSAELYDPASGAWSAVPSMSAARQEAAAVALPGGRVLLVGGSDLGGAGVTATELFDPATRSWSATDSFSHAALGNTATLLFDGRVLAHGFDAAAGANRADLYVPSAATIEATSVSNIGGTRLTGQLALSGQPAGFWDLLVRNPDGKTADLPGAFTLYSRVPSAEQTGGRPTVELTSLASGMSVVATSTQAPDTALALASASAQGLSLVSLVYDISPDVAFAPPADIVFRFDVSVVADTSTLALYRFDGIQWSSTAAGGIIEQVIALDSGDPRVVARVDHASLWALFVPEAAPAPASLVWTGAAGDGAWHTPGNWSPSQVPTAIDSATIAAAATVLISSGAPAATFASLTLGDAGGVSAPTLLVAGDIAAPGTAVIHNRATLLSDGNGVLTAGSWDLRSGAKATHVAATALRQPVLRLRAAGDILVAAGASLDAAGRGYPAGTGTASGPGAGVVRGGGGGHGGFGGGGADSAAYGQAYDDMLDPTQPGSSGAGTPSSSRPGGDGGGVVILEAAGTLRMNGTISVDGTAPQDFTGAPVGGGAGGSIQLRAGVLEGNGTLTARGGNGNFNVQSAGGGGGGGRILIETATDSSALAVDASGGRAPRENGSGFNAHGGAGTIVRKAPGLAVGDLRLRNSHGQVVRTPTPVSSPIEVSTLTISAAVLASSGSPQPVDVLSSLALTGPYGVYVSSLTFPPVASFTIPSRSTVSVSFISVPAGSDWNVAGSLYIPALSAGGLALSGTLRADSVSATTLSLGVADLETSTLTISQGTAFTLPANARLKALRAYLPSGADWTIGGSLLIGDPLHAGTLSILPTARISPPVPLVTVDIRASGDMTLSSGSVIAAAGMGHSARGGGPGAGCDGGGGAGHGGRGGLGGCLIFGPVYDDPINPVEFGSAGGGEFSPLNEGGAGGGAVFLRSSGVLTLDGLVDASGLTAFNTQNRRAGGGSGGSINLRARELRGGGVLRADGGGGNVGVGGTGTESGGGGGGRILVDAETDSSTLVFSVAGGLKGKPTQSNGAPSDGEPGTVVRLPIVAASADGSASLASHVFGSSVTTVSTAAASTAYSVAVSTQGLFSLSPFYEITPSPIVFDPPATFSIEFDPAGIDPASAAIYFFDGVSWDSAAVAGQTFELLPDGRARVTGTLAHASLYALFAKDVTPPLLALLPPDGSTVTTTVPSVVMTFSDAGGGVSTPTARLFLDGADVTAAAAVFPASATFTPAPLSQGPYVASAQVSDHAGNSSTARSAFFIDSLPPLTRLLVNGLQAGSTVLSVVSTDSLGFEAEDAGVGVAETRYSLAGSSAEVVYVSTFSLPVGTHTLVFRSIDRAGNAEAASTAFLSVLAPDAEAPLLTLSPPHGSTLTTVTPTLAASYSDAGRGVDLASVRLFLDGVEVTSAAAVASSSAVFTPSAALSQGAHTFSASLADLAGNGAEAAASFLVDSLPPLTALLIDGVAVASTHSVVSSTSSVGFAAADAGSGVLETLYSLDGAAQTVFVSTFSLAAGARSLAFQSRDRAGNLEPLRGVTLDVVDPFADTTPPLVRLDFPGAGALQVEQAVGAVVDVRGAVSDESAASWTLDVAPGASATSGFAAVASGAGNLSGLIAVWNTAGLSGPQTLRLRAVDAFGNAAEAVAGVFVGVPVFDFAIGRKDAHVIVSTLKGPTGIAPRSDGALWVARAENDRILLISQTGVLLGAAGQAPGHSGEEHGKKDKDDDKGKDGKKGKKGHDDDDDEDDDDDDRRPSSGGPSFKSPQGLAVDSADNLYVADKGEDRVLKLSPDGAVVLLALGRVDGKGRPKSGSGDGEFKDPWDVAVDGNGDIYVADSGNSRIQVFNASGTYLRQFGAGVLPSDSQLRGIALSSEGLWVSDKESERVYLFSRAGALLKSIGDADSVVGELSRMRGLASDRLGALYVVEPNRDRVQKFDPQGKGLLAFGSRAGLSKPEKHAKRYLTQPIDAAIAPDGSIWVTDTGRDRIVRYALPSSGGFGVAANAPGGGFSSSSVEPARRLVDHKDGAKVERDDGAGVNVPRGALSADLEVTVDKGDENEDKEHKDAKRAEKKVAAVSEEVQYGPEGTTFSVPVTLTIPYDAALVASQGIKEDELKVYYWNPSLKDWQAMPSVVDKVNKTVNAQTTHFSAYQVQGPGGGGIGVAAVDDFGLRDAYVFPNPSRNGAAVTFRIQPGRADSVELRVYDLSGRRIHSSSDFRFLGAIDDGNGKGAQNTYDHVWGVSGVGSGVYYFVITAKRAGESDIRKTGKVAVIR